MFDEKMIREFYEQYPAKVAAARSALKRGLTLCEKILYAHLWSNEPLIPYRRGEDYVEFRPDRVALQDATAQMALLQFMNAGAKETAVPTSIHCDHLIRAEKGSAFDLPIAEETNKEVYDFLKSVAGKYGMAFWKPGAGIIHQIVLENYAFPGGMMVGTDSHTPNAGGLGMFAVGVGGADAVDVMTGLPWELKMPKIIGVHLTGKLSPWCLPKDVILNLAGLLTVKGATNAVLEYFGEGARTLSATGKASICNMGAEVGATASLFPFDSSTEAYLEITGRKEVANMARKLVRDLEADPEVKEHPEQYYDRIIEINLSELTPYLNGPFTPDAAHPVSEMAKLVKENCWPDRVESALLGSCTNSSYEDFATAAAVVQDAMSKGLKAKAEFIVNPGSRQILETIHRDGILDVLEKFGAKVMTNACGPCIGQWKRDIDDNTRRNSIVTSFNRNFAKRADGNPNTYAFVASPAMVAAMAVSGRLDFNPITDSLINENGEEVMLAPPSVPSLPPEGFAEAEKGVSQEQTGEEVFIDPASKRIQRLQPFAAPESEHFHKMPLLIKVKGKCTTDHISMAGPWLKYRGHLENISQNLLMGAVNAFSGKTDEVRGPEGQSLRVSEAAAAYKAAGLGSVVVAEENYGEGSSREHAALEPRFLNVKVVLVKSFARIHETNLKKQGVLALTFKNKDDYDKIREDDLFRIPDISVLAPGESVDLTLIHSDGSEETITALHTYNDQQLKWFKAGSALNYAGRKELSEADKNLLSNQPVVPFIQGDGVGPEVMKAAVKVLDAAVSSAYKGTKAICWKEVPAGEKAFKELGTYLPDETMEAFRKYGIGIKGPLMTPVGGGIRSLNVALRQGLDLFVCLRPVRWFKGIVSPVKEPQKVNMHIFRENTEDIYAGIEWKAGSPEADKFRDFLINEMGVTKIRFPKNCGFGVKPVSKEGSERLIRAALNYAVERDLPTVTLVHKGNIMKFTEGAFKNWGYELAKTEFRDKTVTQPELDAIAKEQGKDAAAKALEDARKDGKILVNDCICDAFLQNSLLYPERYSVIATLNLNGDYVSDQLAAMVGGIGISPGANINFLTNHAIFEATHGTAPDIAGQNKANPSSLILSGVMMLEHLGWTQAAEKVIDAMQKCFEAGEATGDLARLMPNGKALSTSEFADALCRNIEEQ